MPRGVKKTDTTTKATAKATTKEVVADVVDETKVVADATVEKDNIKLSKSQIHIEDNEEFEIVSLVPNVSYFDKKSGDMYEWEEEGHIENMPYEVLKTMWINSKDYFRNMHLRPLDDRLVQKFGIGKILEQADFLMDEDNYTTNNIDNIIEIYSNMPNGLKYTICERIASLVVDSKITNVSIIRKLENGLNIELLSFLD